ncbi:MAG: phosphodiester glycosidase family protein [Fimbriimonas sp.]
MSLRLTLLIGIVLAGIACSGPLPMAAPRTKLIQPPPHELAAWPWSSSKVEALAKGITLTSATAPDGTRAELFQIDLTLNRLNLYDQDQDDTSPHDNAADYSRTVDQLLPHLEEVAGCQALLAWNGPFFAYDPPVARHIGPVVQNGKLHYNVGNHRWTFTAKGTHFDILHMPDKRFLEAKHLDFGVAGVQALIKDGKPLNLEPFPDYEDQIKRPPVPSTPADAGHIPLVDHMRTSRTSLAWSKDGKLLKVLIVTESDHELGSKLGLKRGEPQGAGWTLADLQRFWLARKAWCAINSDGGDVTQRVYRRPKGSLDVVLPRKREGTLMSFFVTAKQSS